MSAPVPDLLTSDDGDWAYYVPGHDPGELWAIDNPLDLEHEPVWMRPIRASRADDFGMYDEDSDKVQRNRKTGRFESRWLWIECSEKTPGAEPFLAAKYKPASQKDQA